jgi:hypothetical protein
MVRKIVFIDALSTPLRPQYEAVFFRAFSVHRQLILVNENYCFTVIVFLSIVKCTWSVSSSRRNSLDTGTSLLMLALK